MIKKFVNYMTRKFIDTGIIERDDDEVFAYGLEIITSASINTIFALIIGTVMGRFIESIIFLVSFCIIRQFCGGYHADSNRKCIISFNSIFAISIILGSIIDIEKFSLFFIILTVMNTVSIFVLAPVCHINNPLSNEEYKSNKFKSRLISMFICIVIIIGVQLNLYKYIIYSCLALTWVNLLMIILKISNIIRGKKYEKSSS